MLIKFIYLCIWNALDLSCLHVCKYRQIPISGDQLNLIINQLINLSLYSYRTDALDVLKGSSLMQYIPDKRMLQDVLQTYFELGRKQRDVGDYYATKTDALMSAAMSRELAHVFDGDDSLRDQALFLVQYKKFINYVNMVPGFLYWHEFDELDERLAKQIQVLKAKYK